jgi:alkanesulfonate monooxygenase SsuD/methylene tetrahydromethanopterin reductase-like flavin-dependent oxidoreductase (luciferase family)
MQFWCATPFMKSTEAVAVARMVDEAGYHGMICGDHLIYPRDLRPALQALWQGGWVSWSSQHYQVPEMMIERIHRSRC